LGPCAPQIQCSVAHTGSRRQIESVLVMKAAGLTRGDFGIGGSTEEPPVESAIGALTIGNGDRPAF
jgi:hypothetical protein